MRVKSLHLPFQAVNDGNSFIRRTSYIYLIEHPRHNMLFGLIWASAVLFGALSTSDEQIEIQQFTRRYGHQPSIRSTPFIPNRVHPQHG